MKKIYSGKLERIYGVKSEKWNNWIPSSLYPHGRRSRNVLEAPRKTFVLRIRYLASSVAAAVVLLLAIGCYFWMVGDDKSSLPLALLEEKSIDSLPDDEIVLVENGSWVQLKNGATITHDNIGKPSVKDSQIKKKVLATKTGNLNQIIVPKGKRANIIFSDGTQIYVNADTRVIYPAVFAKDKREILVTGEAYLVLPQILPALLS